MPRAKLDVPFGIGGPLLVAAALKISPESRGPLPAADYARFLRINFSTIGVATRPTRNSPASTQSSGIHTSVYLMKSGGRSASPSAAGSK